MDSNGESGQTENTTSLATGTTTEPVVTSGSGASSGANLNCAADSVCISEVLGGWDGPGLVTVAASGTEPACPTGSELGFQMFSEAQAEPAVCDCSCGAVGEVVCSGEMRIHDGDECPVVGMMNLEVGETCSPFPPAFDPAHYWSLETSVDEGGCEPTTAVVFPPVVAETRLDVCFGGAEEGECEGGVCLPGDNIGEARHCVWAPGDLACPDDTGLSDRLLGYAGFEDNRGCLDCTCASPEGSCRARAELFSSADCAPGTEQGVVAWDGRDSCVLATEGVSSAQLVFDPDPAAECIPSEPQPTGSVVQLQPTTFCCSPN